MAIYCGRILTCHNTYAEKQSFFRLVDGNDERIYNENGKRSLLTQSLFQEYSLFCQIVHVHYEAHDENTAKIDRLSK